MTPNKPDVRVGLACFVWRNGKFLMIRRKGAHGAGTRTVPGGHVEHGESWEDCAMREILEETGVTVDEPRLLTVTNDIMAADNKHYVTIWMEANWLSGEPQIMEPDKVEQLEWRTFQDLPSPLFEPGWTNLRIARPDLFEP